MRTSRSKCTPRMERLNVCELPDMVPSSLHCGFTKDFNFSYCLLDGSDYGGPEVIMVDFQAGKNSSTFSVPIINGSEIESPENFYLELRIPASTAEKGVARGGIYTARVKIIEGMKLLSMNIHVH